MYAFWYWGRNGELRPFEARDFEGMSSFKIRSGTSMWDLHNFENSPWTAGQYLMSQCLRYRATRDDEALRFAAKAFRSLDANYRLAEDRGEPGFMCKPHGLKYTKETSPDQYTAFVPALWAYREICDASTRARIDQMIPAMSDWWRLRDYKLVYFDHEGDWLRGDATYQYGPFYAAMHLMAYKITGRHECRVEADRLIEMLGDFRWRHDQYREQILREGKCFWPERLHGAEYDPSRRAYLHLDWEIYSAIWMAASPVAWLIENHDDPRLLHTLRHALGNYLRHARQNLTEDFNTLYWTQTDLESGKCYPLVRERISTNRKDFLIDFDWNFFAYAGKFYWTENAAFLIDTAMLANHLAPQFSPGALSLAMTMLTKLDDARMKYMVDPDGEQLMASEKWLCDCLPSATVMYSLAYWRARAWGISL